MADFTNKTKLFFLSGIDNLRDPVRSTRWRVLIPSEILRVVGLNAIPNGSFLPDEDGTNDFALHVKSCKIPDMNIEAVDQYYMGFGQSHVTNAQLSADIQFESILLEDMRAFNTIHAWQQMCINTGLLVNTSGENIINNSSNIREGLGVHKDSAKNDLVGVVRNSNVTIELYNWMNGDVIAQTKLINAYPKSVGGFSLSYQNAGLINFPFTLHCDRWTSTTIDGYDGKANKV